MKKIRILIVDDHQLVLDGLKALIGNVEEFIFAGEANSGDEALSLARATDFDIILMDIEMDGINGIETTRQLLKVHPAARIIAVTMYNEKGMIDKALEAGVCGYVLKNVNKGELTDANKKVMAGEKYFSREVEATLREKKSKAISADGDNSNAAKLTKREIEILSLIAQGLSNREEGKNFFFSPG